MSGHGTRSDRERVPIVFIGGQRAVAEALARAGYRVIDASRDDAGQRAGMETAALIVVEVGDGAVDVVHALRRHVAIASLPIIAITASDGQQQDRALDAGADDAVALSSGLSVLLVRVRALLRLAAYRRELKEKASELGETTGTLYSLIRQQVDELQRVSQLRRFLSPQLAELVLSTGGNELLASHRRDVAVVFCDLRGFTAFAEAVSPDEVITVLGDFHATLGRTIFEFGATVERFAGDAIMAFLNDPLPCPDPALRAVRMALAMQERVAPITRAWRDRGYDLDLGIGVAFGPATVGTVGFEDRVDYAVIGPVTNLAARLCAAARGGEVLVSEGVRDALGERLSAQAIGSLRLKGLRDPVPVYRAQSVESPEQLQTQAEQRLEELT
jgi:class 3 adenylate cyclase/CheY-like chemotaxis protein